MKDANLGWKDAIVDVLKRAKGPLHYKKITEEIEKSKLKQFEGKTPKQTVSYFLTTDLNKGPKESIFERVSSGVYKLRTNHTQQKGDESLGKCKVDSKNFDKFISEAINAFSNVYAFRVQIASVYTNAKWNGYYKKIGLLEFAEKTRCSLVIFNDEITEKNRWWIGFAFKYNEETLVDDFIDCYKLKIGQEFKKGKDFDEKWLLHWINESWQGTDDLYLGIYFDESQWAQALKNIVSPFLNEDAAYSSTENRKKMRYHFIKERDSIAPRLRKEADNYICKICGIDFTKEYKGYGTKIAEAHHITPLGKIDTAINVTKDSFVTVCPNCHTLIHKFKLFTQEELDGFKRVVPKKNYAK